jgi:hypothetical protein
LLLTWSADLSQITIQSIRISHVELLDLSQLADFCWQGRELVVGGLKACDTSQIKIQLPRMPHEEYLQIGQQAELGRKRRELVAPDLKTTRLLVRDHDPIASTVVH